MKSFRSILHRAAVAAWLLLFVAGISVTIGAEPPTQPVETIEVFAEDGTITRMTVPTTPNHPADAQHIPQTDVDIIQATGPVTNRIAIVMLGDGYTQSQLGTYALNTTRVWQQVIQEPPFSTYQSYFHVYRVNVVSQESGVDNDPTQGITRDTALDMRYWCYNTARAICFNVTKAQQYVAQAPKADQVIALANSTTYGGAANDTMVAIAGRNSYSPSILIHELGHSLGRLQDEYVVLDQPYTGPEPLAANISTFTGSSMAHAQVKWYRWLGESTPDGGIIDTYEGASLGENGIYRPSENSVMRSLRKPFNLPGREALVMAIYQHVRPIDSSTPITATLAPDDTITVTPQQPHGHSLTVTWRVNGSIIVAAQNQHQLHLADLALDTAATVTVEVSDPTAYVRDEVFRAAFMRETRQWAVEAPTAPVWTIAIPMAMDGAVATP